VGIAAVLALTTLQQHAFGALRLRAVLLARERLKA
jgi:hypothetical protein